MDSRAGSTCTCTCTWSKVLVLGLKYSVKILYLDLYLYLPNSNVLVLGLKYNALYLTPSLAMMSPSWTVLIVLLVNTEPNNEYIQLCDIATLFGCFLGDNWTFKSRTWAPFCRHCYWYKWINISICLRGKFCLGFPLYKSAPTIYRFCPFVNNQTMGFSQNVITWNFSVSREKNN